MNARALPLASLLLVPALLGQEPGTSITPPPTATELVTRFRALRLDQREEVMRNLERRLQRSDDDAIQRITARSRGRAAYPSPASPRWFQPADFAPVATPRALVAAGSAAHDAATRGMRPSSCPADLVTGVGFDWGRATVVRTPAHLTLEQSFANLVSGYLPGADEAMAQVLVVLHSDPQQRRLAEYFEHLYADRTGNVFADVTLYDAWNSGVQIEMPDTDAIAFARQILGTRAFVAPLPADRRRERLYEKMREAFTDYREYRTLRQVLAATFVAAEPPVDGAYVNLVPRCHWLWSQCGDDPAVLAKRLAASPDRSSLLKTLDEEMALDATPARRRQTDLLDLALHLRLLAEQEIARAND